MEVQNIDSYTLYLIILLNLKQFFLCSTLNYRNFIFVKASNIKLLLKTEVTYHESFDS